MPDYSNLSDEQLDALIAQKSAQMNEPKKTIFGGNVGKSTLSIPLGRRGMFSRSLPSEKEQLDLDDARKQAERESEMIRNNAQGLLDTTERVKKGLKYFGPMGDLPTAISPSTYLTFGKEYGPRIDWENNINKLLSGKVVDLITQMKSASKTGATGFGQLSEKEGQILREASTALKKNLLPEQASSYLSEIENMQKKVLGMPPDQGSDSATAKKEDLKENLKENLVVGNTFRGGRIKKVTRIE